MCAEGQYWPAAFGPHAPRDNRSPPAGALTARPGSRQLLPFPLSPPLASSGSHRSAAGRWLQVARHFLLRPDALGASQPFCTDKVSIRERVTALPTPRRGWCGGRWGCSRAVAPDSAVLEAAPGGLGGPGERTGLRWEAACSPATAGFPGVMPGLALQEEQGHTCALWGLVSSEGRSGVLGPSADRCFRCKTPLS